MSKNYSKHYSPEKLTAKLHRYAKKAGSEVVYNVLLLYNLLNDKSTPVKVRVSIIAALGYFILPTDLMPDLMPMLGFTDDLAVLVFTINQVSGHITPEIRRLSRQQANRYLHLDDEVAES